LPIYSGVFAVNTSSFSFLGSFIEKNYTLVTPSAQGFDIGEKIQVSELMM
jgi:hypothetical protein